MPRNKKQNNQKPKQSKRKRRNNNGNKGVPTLAPVIKNAVASGLRAAGGYLGGMVGGPAGAAFGTNAGAWVSKLIGSGDYTVTENSIVRGSAHGVPTFSIGNHSVRIKHREYLGDITGSTAFSSRPYLLQPGSTVTFPWLSQIAKGFQQYKFHGLVFCFNSTSANALNSVNTALGTVIMATQYNVNRPLFTSKLEMEGYEFSCACKPCDSLMHPIECDPKQLVMENLYIRNGAVPANEDARLYDMGQFQLATVGMQAAANIGELWVTYDIELLKPRLAPGGDFGGEYTRILNGAYTNSAPLGVTQTTPIGNLGITITASSGSNFDTVFFPAVLTTGRYLVTMNWAGSSVVWSRAPPALNNLTYVTGGIESASTFVTYPDNNATTTKCSMQLMVTINGYSATGSSIVLGAMTLPSAGVLVTVIVTELPGSDTFV